MTSTGIYYLHILEKLIEEKIELFYFLTQYS